MAHSTQLFIIVVVMIGLTTCSDEKQECKGGPHDQFLTCGSQCPLTCDNPEPRLCIRSCNINVCECKSGFYRRHDGQCVRLEDCKCKRS